MKKAQNTWSVKSYDAEGLLTESYNLSESDALSEISEIKRVMPQATGIVTTHKAGNRTYVTEAYLDETDSWRSSPTWSYKEA